MNEEAILSMNRWVVVGTFIVSLLIFVGIGALATLQRKSNTQDYLLAGRGMPPWLVALSAVATLASGFMFIGQIGLTYRVGLSSMWWLIGWAMGDLLAWNYVYTRLRRASEARNEVSAVAMMGPEQTNGRRWLVPMAGVLTVFFLGMYAAAQLKAGSTALESVFGIPDYVGVIIGAVVVLLICYAGGLRATIWTDSAQAIVMFAGMAILAAAASVAVGGPAGLMPQLAAIDPALTNALPADLRFGFLIWFMGMIFGGFGVVGQPHILVRSMSITDAEQLRAARLYYFLWLIPFYAMAIWVGLHARVLLPELMASATLSTEQALPLLTIDLLPDIVVGLMLAALFSATMSTADSLIIACTTSVTQDIRPSWSESYTAVKLTTLVVTAIALTIALGSGKGVFALVLDAWAILTCTLGPLLLIILFRLPYSQLTGGVMIVVGFVATNIWIRSDFAGESYVNFPGMMAVFLTYFVLLGIHKLGMMQMEKSTA